MPTITKSENVSSASGAIEVKPGVYVSTTSTSIFSTASKK